MSDPAEIDLKFVEVTRERDALRAELKEWQDAFAAVKGNFSPAELAASAIDNRKKLDALVYAVERKFVGEERYETALRYIKEAEEPPFSGPSEGKQPL